jgi:hypothetical protein
MSVAHPIVLIAAPISVLNKLKAGVADEVEVIGAETYEQAVACIHEREVHLLIVCYIFDNVRPYRLLNYIQDLGRRPNAMLIRALPIPLREREQELRTSYEPLGVREFQNFSDEENAHGREAALARFRTLVLGLLRTPKRAG